MYKYIYLYVYIYIYMYLYLCIYLHINRCQIGSVAEFLRIDPIVSGSNPTSAKLSLRVRGVASSL